MSSEHKQAPQYSMLIEWSNLDQAYIVSLPEWESIGASAKTHGSTYSEAAEKGEALLRFLISSAEREGDNIPTPAGYDAHAYAEGETPESMATDIEKMVRAIEARETHPSQSA